MANTGLTMQQGNAKTLEEVLIRGDLSRLNDEQRVVYYNRVCESLRLNPLTRPLEYVKLSGREVLYVRKDATDQLRKLHNISVKVTSREKIEDVFVVTALATNPEGRTDESIGAVTVAGLKGDSLANALMKAETKAKRRATLSICGLGMLDETEVETIPEALAQPRVRPELTKQALNEKTPEEKAADAVDLAAKKAALEIDAIIRADQKASPEAYRIPEGKYKDKLLKDISPMEIRGYIEWITDKAKFIPSWWPEFLDQVDAHMAQLAEKRQV